MRWIPPEPFREAEYRLRNRQKARKEAERILAEALSDAVSLTSPIGHEGGSRKGTPGDPTGRGAEIVLRAREKIEILDQWEKAIRRAERDFPPGTDEHKAALLYYEGGQKLTDIAKAMHFERQAIIRKKDAFVCRVAWYAAEAGLTRRDT